MSYDNRLTADQIGALQPGDTVLIENWPAGWRDPLIDTGTVVKLTATQVVIECTSSRERTYEVRFRRKDGYAVGDLRSELVDPAHPRTARDIAAAQRKRRQQTIDRLADRWRRDRGDLELLGRLAVAIDEYLNDEAAR